MSKRGPLALAVGFILCAGTQNLLAQRDRIAAQVDRRDTFTLSGHVHPAATAANDRGRADAAMPMPNMTLLLTPSADQQKALDNLLTRQQDPSSPDYHHWLTPEEYGDRFGLSPTDIGKITAWLQSEGFTVISTARGRNSIAFRGTASQVEKAFHTEMHRYLAEGQLHYANAMEPSIPAALRPVIGSIRGLHDFRPRARRLRVGHYTNTAGQGGGYQIAPDDVATIYDVKALYSQGINGNGQKVAIVGQVQIDVTDIQQFRTAFNLPASDPQLMLVPGLPSPPTGATDSGDLGESDLDIETAGAVARGATVIFVYSQNVDDAITWAIDQNLAPVLSSSYGLCEADLGSTPAGAKAYALGQQMLAQQANVQGMTWVTASGDNGAVDCWSGGRTNPGPGADEPGTIPEVTSVGGTEFTEGSSNYWSSSNNANGASALSYIPETTWNDSVPSLPSASGGGASMFFPKPSWQTGTGVPNDGWRDVPDISFSSSADHDGYLIYSGGSMQVFGGTSVSAPLFAGVLTLLNQYEVVNGFQKTPGLANVNPKLYALAASSPDAFHDITTGNNAVDPCGARTAVCQTPIGFNAGVGYDQATGLGSIDVFNFISAWNGGKAAVRMTLSANVQSPTVVLTASVTSSNSTAPTGTVTWYLNGSTLGSASLRGTGATASASLTLQTSQLPGGTFSLTATYSGDANFNAASGSQTITQAEISPTLMLTSNPQSIAQAGSTVLTAVVAGSGSSTPTGTVTWSAGSVTLGSVTLSGSAGKATATLTLPGYQLGPGTFSLSAQYTGDGTYSPASGSLPLSVTGISGATNSASFKQVYAPGMIMSVFGSQLAGGTQIASTLPLPTQMQGASVTVSGVPAPLYFVAPGQINLQIPYSVAANSNAVVKVSYNGQTYTQTIAIAAAAPGIFYDAATGGTVPNETASRGQTIAIFVTGDGAASPQPATGSTPATGTIPVPVQDVSITVGGVPVPTPFAFIGIPSWSIGATQIDFTVPVNAPLGPQPVVVTVGGIASPAAALTITN